MLPKKLFPFVGFWLILISVSCQKPPSESVSDGRITPSEVSLEATENFPTSTDSATITPTATQTKPPEPTEIPIVTLIPTAIPVDPAIYQSWWTYQNDTYGFSLLLPEDWSVVETTSGDSLLNGHLINLQPNKGENLDIRLTFRRQGEDIMLWPTGVGAGEFIQNGTLDLAGEPARRMLFICPTGQVQSIWYQGQDFPNIQRGDLEFGAIFSLSGVYCEDGYSLDGKTQLSGEMIIASLRVP